VGFSFNNMTKESAKKFLPLIEALSNGKTIQRLVCGRWKDCYNPGFVRGEFRIKPESQIITTYFYQNNKGEIYSTLIENKDKIPLKKYTTTI
jgi:hypothetical protein